MKSFLIYLLTVCVFLSGCAKTPSSDVTVKNESGSEIEEVEVIVCKQTFVTKDMKPNEERIFTYTVKGDSGYHIDIKFPSGVVLNKKDGYVTSGFIFHDVIVIDANEIKLISNAELVN